jgi:hypothetical protein
LADPRVVLGLVEAFLGIGFVLLSEF